MKIRIHEDEIQRFKSHSDSDGRECKGIRYHKRIGYMRRAGNRKRNPVLFLVKVNLDKNFQGQHLNVSIDLCFLY